MNFAWYSNVTDFEPPAGSAGNLTPLSILFHSIMNINMLHIFHDQQGDVIFTSLRDILENVISQRKVVSLGEINMISPDLKRGNNFIFHVQILKSMGITSQLATKDVPFCWLV